MKPTLGRIVHYTSRRESTGPRRTFAAIITGVRARWTDPADATNEHAYAVDIRVLADRDDFWEEDVAFTTEPAGSDAARGKWSWPARE